MPSTMLMDRKRSWMKPQTPRPGFGWTPQMVFKASWSWPNSPAAPNSSMTMPRTLPTTPVEGLLALSSIKRMALPPCSPTRF